MKLQIEILAENNNLTLKGGATFPFDLQAWKHRVRICLYRTTIFVLLCWPTLCDGTTQVQAKCHTSPQSSNR